MVKYVFGGEDVEDRAGSVPRLVPAGTPVSVFTDSVGTTAATGLKTMSGVTITSLVTNDKSQIPIFYRQADDLDTLYIEVLDGPLVPIFARGDERMDALVARVDSLEDSSSSTVDLDGLPAGMTLTVFVVGSTWPDRPTDRTDMTVVWTGGDENNPPPGAAVGVDKWDRPVT